MFSLSKGLVSEHTGTRPAHAFTNLVNCTILYKNWTLVLFKNTDKRIADTLTITNDE